MPSPTSIAVGARLPASRPAVARRHADRRAAAPCAGPPLLQLAGARRVPRAEGLVQAPDLLAGKRGAQEGHALAHAARGGGGRRPLKAPEAELAPQRGGALTRAR